MEGLLTYEFLQRAFIAGIFVAVACAFLSVFLILKRDSMIGHGLAHVTFAGVALGLFLNILPLATALGVAVLTALLIMRIKERAGLYGDTAIAIFSSVGFAVGILFATLAQSMNVNIFAYLFGEILAIELLEVWISIGLAGVIIGTMIFHFRKFMYITFDRESARVSGIKVRSLETLLTVLTAVTVVLAMKLVGIILVSALIVIPGAAGLQVATHFKQALFLSVIVAVSSVVGGMLIAFYLDFPASGTIVLFSFFLFGIFYFFRKEKRML
ncbi:metal ABC transporter permease [bacterium]|nr:metal ABC transporter permease [bacterium]